MATLTALQLAQMRRHMQRIWTTEIDFPKSTINAVFQAIEDEYEDGATARRKGFEAESAAIMNTTASPKVFTNPELKRIGDSYFEIKLSF